ncbi:hypothetical protein CPAR01_14374 [Colletotrichum paranaense]|uniref:Uncharacterized protein n=1 Tax=Colletotrichum paranaense TaxID=1914294 RepID=A0ABQ9S209_9PEZI|nr:uncharacterized protein CPAR01_14374 [Colletotrichum paranaense]KAK1522831.1 hypothetical protein CPAR01_14374 [Colletotrichum paranaense]
MCHFVWYDNECSSCGFNFDRKLTKCKYVNARVPRPACDKTYLRENQPDFRCQNCTAPETPWRKVEFLVNATEGNTNADEADDHTDYPTDDDCRDGDYKGDDESASSEDDGDVESQRKIGNSKRKLEGSTWQGTRRSLKRACKERGIRRIGMLN